MRKNFAAVAAFLLALACSTGPGHAQAGALPTEMWAAYKAKFLDGSGRIVDNGNGNVSHTEGQGYGLLLAYLANDPEGFEQIWSFTRTELLVRDDGLAAWRWEPDASPHVTDVNNASDGDILIAYALALAGSHWNKPVYVTEASSIAKSVLRNLVVTWRGRTILLPAAEGFDQKHRDDGPVINPSYWVFEAFPVLALLAPSEKWSELSDEGLRLMHDVQLGPSRLPSEWVSLATAPKLAAGFPAEYGYNALRIPLYLMRGGVTEKALLDRFRRGWSADDTGGVGIVDIPGGRVKERLDDPGYQIINHIAACITDGTKLGTAVQQFNPVLYYPSTLQLLGLAFVRENYPQCL